MLRRLITVRSYPELDSGWRARRDPGIVDATMAFCRRTFALEGLEFHRRFVPVPVADPPVPAGKSKPGAPARPDYAIPVRFQDEAAIARAQKQAWCTGVFSNPVMGTTDYYCGIYHVGLASQVAALLGVPALRKAGLTGRGVKIAVVDTCLDGTKVRVAGGWSPDAAYQPGNHRVVPEAWLRSKWNHGTMCALDAAIAAPDADFLDYAMLFGMGRPASDETGADMGTAVRAFAELVEERARDRRPLIVMCPWGHHDRADDLPSGSPGNYSANPIHPLNRKIAELAGAGADILFAAGNCGAECPDARCGADRGPGRSIHGANSHPDVTTVAAVTTDRRRLGYSSQGPGAIEERKPDLAAYSHFRGSGVYAIDTGTSAACGVAAGVCAALRQLPEAQTLTPEQLRRLLHRTASRNGSRPFDHDIGYGIVNAAAALAALSGR
jgi:subtilisin family serine protease